MTINAVPIFLAEPPAQYLVRPAVVIDCSVFAAFVFREEGAELAFAQMLGKTLHAPFLLEIEMASLALKKYKAAYEEPGEPSLREVADQGLRHFEDSDIIFHALSSAGALKLAAQYQLTAYDASYLWLAAQLKCPLLTFDEGLGKAAQIHLATLS